MKIIITDTYENYVRCCHQNSIRVGQVPHITKPSDVEKLPDHGIEPIYFGTFYKLQGIEDIEKAMRSRGIKVKGKYIKK